MVCTLRQSCVAPRRLSTEQRINAPPVFLCCVFVFFPADRIVQEQCCVKVLEDNMCAVGINVAKDQGACDSLLTSTCETKTTKVCLYVCVSVRIHMFVHVCLTSRRRHKRRKKTE